MRRVMPNWKVTGQIMKTTCLQFAMCLSLGFAVQLLNSIFARISHPPGILLMQFKYLLNYPETLCIFRPGHMPASNCTCKMIPCQQIIVHAKHCVQKRSKKHVPKWLFSQGIRGVSCISSKSSCNNLVIYTGTFFHTIQLPDFSSVLQGLLMPTVDFKEHLTRPKISSEGKNSRPG